MKTKNKIIISVAIIVVASILLIIGNNLTSKNKEKEVNKFEFITIDGREKIYVNGEVKSVDSKEIFLDATEGKVDSVKVTDGQVVKNGDVLFTYKNDTVSSQITELSNSLTKFENQKNKLINKKSEANSLLEEKKKDLESADELSMTMIQTEIQSLEAEVSSYNDQIDNVEDSITDTNNQISNLRNKEYKDVTANFDGIVNIIGASDNYTSAFMTISSDNLYIEGTVNEKYVRKLKKDQEAEIMVIATKENVKGKITYVGNRNIETVAQVGTETSSFSNYEVEISLDSQENILDGYHVQVTFYDDEQEIIIDKSCVITNKDKNYVFKNVNNKLVKTEITFEEKSEDKVKVLSGLNNDDKVLLNPTDETKEGMKCE